MIARWKTVCLHETGHAITALGLGVGVKSVTVERISARKISGECLHDGARAGIVRATAISLGGIFATNLFSEVVDLLPEPTPPVESLADASPIPPPTNRKRRRMSLLVPMLSPSERRSHNDRDHIMQRLQDRSNADTLFSLADFWTRRALEVNRRVLVLAATYLSAHGELDGEALADFVKRIERVDV